MYYSYQTIVISLLIIKLSSSPHNSQYIHQPCAPPTLRSIDRFRPVIDHSNPLARNIHTVCCVHRLCLNCGETKLENLTACHLSVVKIGEKERERGREQGYDEIESINSLPECPYFIHLFNCRSNHVLIQSSNLLVLPRFDETFCPLALLLFLRTGSCIERASVSSFEFFFNIRFITIYSITFDYFRLLLRYSKLYALYSFCIDD